jgi:hypothetical protein
MFRENLFTNNAKGGGGMRGEEEEDKGEKEGVGREEEDDDREGRHLEEFSSVDISTFLFSQLLKEFPPSNKSCLKTLLSPCNRANSSG